MEVSTQITTEIPISYLISGLLFIISILVKMYFEIIALKKEVTETKRSCSALKKEIENCIPKREMENYSESVRSLELINRELLLKVENLTTKVELMLNYNMTSKDKH